MTLGQSWWLLSYQLQQLCVCRFGVHDTGQVGRDSGGKE